MLPYPQAAVPTPGSTREFLRVPTTKGLKESACTPLFWNAFRMRDAGACIHTHSQHAGQSSSSWLSVARLMRYPCIDVFNNRLARSHGYATLARQGVHDLASGGEGSCFASGESHRRQCATCVDTLEPACR